MKRLPIAKAVFRKLIEGDFCYVDKTPYIKQLEDAGDTYWFLARPRRFGKSLFVDTLRAAYSGEKELFKGLFLENNWDWSKQYPVIKINFGGGTAETKQMLYNNFDYQLRLNAEKYQVDIKENEISDRFKELIIKLYQKYDIGVVVLIDEYDKPLLDNITEKNAKEMRDALSNIYSILKATEDYLKFVFITGVSKFSRTSIFSKLNNLTEISLKRKYADICGYTQHDLETVFADYLHDVDMEKIKDWYDGYNFLGNNLYNPYNILLFLDDKEYKPYWFETGTPTFLLKLIKERKFYVPELENIELADTQMSEFDIDHIDLNVLLLQTGYLTITSEKQSGIRTYYTLRFPNKEVRFGFNDYLLRMFYTIGANTNDRTKLYQKIYYAIADNKPEDLEAAFYAFFSSIPVDWYRKNDIDHFEGFYSSMFYAFFAAQGFDIIPEDFTNKGKIDLTIITNTGVFIFEFKMKTNPQNALAQIKTKKYYEKYIIENKAIFLIGIEFDEDKKNISLFECKKINKQRL